MIPGDQEIRNREPVENRTQPAVLFGLAAVGEVAGRDHEIRPRNEQVDRADRPAELASGVNHVVQQIALAADVGVRDLRDQHDSRTAHHDATRVALSAPGQRSGAWTRSGWL